MSLLISVKELSLWRDRAIQAAIAASISPAEVDWLLQEVTGLDALALRLGSYKQPENIQLEKPLSVLTQLWQQRLQKRVPVQYLVGTTPWRHFSLKVSPEVLIPRPETELIVDLAVDAAKQNPLIDIHLGHWVDLGTGSGAIALGLAEVLTEIPIHAVDKSEAALTIARENAENLGFTQRIKFYRGSWWEPLEHLKGKVRAMVSNPPYIPTVELSQLQPEVNRYEPHLALDGGTDGFESIRHLIETSPQYLHSGAIWLIEMMAGQAPTVEKMLEANGSYRDVKIISDLAGIDRFALAYRC